MRDNLIASSIQTTLRREAPLALLLAAVIAGLVAATLLPPWILKSIIDNHLVPKEASGLTGLALFYCAAIILSLLLDFLKEVLLTILGQGITREIRSGMMAKLISLPSSYFSKTDSGAIVSRFSGDVDTINALFSGGVVGMIVDSFKIIGICLSIYLFSPRLFVLSLTLLPLIALLTRYFQRRMLSAQIENRVEVQKLGSHLSESLKNIRMIKVFHREQSMEDQYTEIIADNYRTLSRINFYDALFPCVIQILRSGAVAAVVILASPESGYLGITAGMMAATIELISSLFSPIENIGMEAQNIQSAISGLIRVNAFAREAEEGAKDEALTAQKIVPDRKQLVIEFRDLSFSYDDEGEVLSGISLFIPPLSKVTFTGRTGVGKSTLFRLVMGLLTPTSGSITVNGVDISRVPNAQKKGLFGYVDQNFFLIPGTVADQITLHDPSIARTAVEQAIRNVGLEGYVQALSRGLDTEVSGDTQFSQGQKQLLSIARAIVTDPPILLLDEMTANLDALTEERIVQVLEEEGVRRTILSISHRPSSIIRSDQVIILEKGRVKNAGPPLEMMEKDEWFKSRMELEKRTWG